MPIYLDITKKDVLKAIEGSHGILTVVAQKLNCCRQTCSNYIRKWPETKQALKDARQKFGDVCELQGVKLVLKEDPNMIKFFLNTLFKDRGYIPTANIEGNVNHNININIELIREKVENDTEYRGLLRELYRRNELPEKDKRSIINVGLERIGEVDQPG